MTHSAIALKHGLSSNYFAVMKKESQAKHAFIRSLDADFDKAYSLYLSMVADTEKRYSQMYYDLLESRSISKFARYAKQNYQRIYNLTSALSSTHGGMLARQEILAHYETYKKEHP